MKAAAAAWSIASVDLCVAAKQESVPGAVIRGKKIVLLRPAGKIKDSCDPFVSVGPLKGIDAALLLCAVDPGKASLVVVHGRECRMGQVDLA